MFNWFKKEQEVESPKPKVEDTRISTTLFADGREEWRAEVYLGHSDSWAFLDKDGAAFYYDSLLTSYKQLFPANQKECEEAILKYKENKLADKLRTTVIKQQVREFP